MRKRIYPTSEPKYGYEFVIKGIQVETIDREYSELFSVELEKSGKEVTFRVGKTPGEWRREKQRISDMICTSLGKLVETPWKDVVAIEVEYTMWPERQVL